MVGDELEGGWAAPSFRTADLWLIHAADCRSRYSLRTCCGGPVPIRENFPLELLQSAFRGPYWRRAGTVMPDDLQGVRSLPLLLWRCRRLRRLTRPPAAPSLCSRRASG